MGFLLLLLTDLDEQYIHVYGHMGQQLPWI